MKSVFELPFMYSITDLKLGTKISLDDEPFAVTFSQHSKQGRGGAVMRTRLKSLISGTTIAKTFQGADKIEEAELIISWAHKEYKEGD